jgi:S-adenosylmethionine synthetase
MGMGTGEAPSAERDAPKVDRSAAYMARYVAKSIVARGQARECEIQVAYAIGLTDPLSFRVNTHGTAVVPEVEIDRLIRDEFSFRPGDIIETLELTRPVFRKTAAYGHFGRKDFSWEDETPSSARATMRSAIRTL